MKSLTEKRTLRQVYNSSYYLFFKDAFKVLEPETVLLDNWHIEYLCNILQKETERIARKEPKTSDIVINIPPRSLKSKIVTIIWNAWIWTKYPYMKIISSSYGYDLSILHALDTRRLIESEWYQSLFGHMFKLESDQNVKSRFQNDKKGERRSTSVGGSITGEGADIAQVDDPTKVQESNSKLSLDTANEWWTKTMYSRLNDQEIGLRVVIMQRLNENDLTGYIIKNKLNYRIICLPAEENNSIQPIELKEKYVDHLLFPNRFSLKTLQETRKVLGSLAYAGQYLQQPAPAEGNMIKAKWFKTFSATEELLKLPRHFRSDTAYGKEGSDNTATICYSIFKEQLFIWSVWKANLGFPDFIKAYKSFVAQNGYSSSSRCIFEPKATGISVIQTLKNDTNLNVIEGESPKESKETRVSSASPSIESGKVLLLEYSSWIDDFVTEAGMFPNAEHDDMLDVLTAIINEELRESPLVISFI